MADDYIKRSYAINAYKTSRSKNNHRTTEGSLVHIQEHNHILHILDKLPSADVVEVVHGEWVKTDKGQKCSNCNCLSSLWDDNLKSVYCPWCGAKMDAIDIDVGTKINLPDDVRQNILNTFMKGSED